MESMANCGSDHHLANLEATELTLGLPGAETAVVATKKRPSADGETARASKTQVVGWPPVRVFRMNSFRIYVKVSMDGAPYLRKIDLKMYKDYEELRGGLEDMFKCFSSAGMEGHDEDDEGEYAITYEDKDGDWMLVGDVPWEMFISSCKRIRIMKGCEARGLSSSA